MNGLPLGAGASIAPTVISAIVLRLLRSWCALSGHLCIDNASLTQRWVGHVRFAASKTSWFGRVVFEWLSRSGSSSVFTRILFSFKRKSRSDWIHQTREMGFLSQSTVRLLTVTARKWSRVSHERLSQRIWGENTRSVCYYSSVCELTVKTHPNYWWKVVD